MINPTSGPSRDLQWRYFRSGGTTSYNRRLLVKRPKGIGPCGAVYRYSYRFKTECREP